MQIEDSLTSIKSAPHRKDEKYYFDDGTIFLVSEITSLSILNAILRFIYLGEGGIIQNTKNDVSGGVHSLS